MLHGVDLSHNNGHPINWKMVKNAGISFVICKASQGTGFTDPVFHSSILGARAAGIKTGPYHFFSSTADPVEQWDHFINVVGGKAGLSGGLVPSLDVEEASDQTAEEYSARVRKWVDACKDAIGKPPLFYTFPFFNEHMLTHTFGDCPLWAASYRAVGHPVDFAGWDGFSFQQYSDKGSVPGIPGHGTVDLDVMNADEFHEHLLYP